MVSSGVNKKFGGRRGGAGAETGRWRRSRREGPLFWLLRTSRGAASAYKIRSCLDADLSLWQSLCDGFKENFNGELWQI